MGFMDGVACHIEESGNQVLAARTLHGVAQDGVERRDAWPLTALPHQPSVSPNHIASAETVSNLA